MVAHSGPAHPQDLHHPGFGRTGLVTQQVEDPSILLGLGERTDGPAEIAVEEVGASVHLDQNNFAGAEESVQMIGERTIRDAALALKFAIADPGILADDPQDPSPDNMLMEARIPRTPGREQRENDRSGRDI